MKIYFCFAKFLLPQIVEYLRRVQLFFSL